MEIASDLTRLIGNTPMVELCRIRRETGVGARLFAKLESRNPLGSVKERAILEMIEDGERKGFVTQGTVVIEPTGGNAATAIAFICAVKGYRALIVMPESIPEDKRGPALALGAEIRLTPASEGMKGAIAEANRLCEEIRNSFMPMQFQNPANPRIHEETTAPEIWRDMDGNVDILVAGFGTGGTISGTGKGLKERNPGIRVVGVEPAQSAVASGGKSGPHKIQGLGPGFLPINLNLDIIDEIIPVSDRDALEQMRILALREAILAGPSSGAVLWAGLRLAERPENLNKNIVLIFADSGVHYLAQGLFQENEGGVQG